ncbi:hypothetical protein [Daejeonella sp.]|uniref:hypothetical protein n=1 Tax=Daejeonella sp. TaxID=2805397 RepID=UPI003983890D
MSPRFSLIFAFLSRRQEANTFTPNGDGINDLLTQGETLPVGVYYWMVDAANGPEKIQKAGSVTVLK